MKIERDFEKFLNFGFGCFYYLKKNLKKLFEEIEKEGEEHSEEIEKIKKELIKFGKIPKKLIYHIIKSFGFITKEDLEKTIQEIKNG